MSEGISNSYFTLFSTLLPLENYLQNLEQWSIIHSHVVDTARRVGGIEGESSESIYGSTDEYWSQSQTATLT